MPGLCFAFVRSILLGIDDSIFCFPLHLLLITVQYEIIWGLFTYKSQTDLMKTKEGKGEKSLDS